MKLLRKYLLEVKAPVSRDFEFPGLNRIADDVRLSVSIPSLFEIEIAKLKAKRDRERRGSCETFRFTLGLGEEPDLWAFEYIHFGDQGFYTDKAVILPNGSLHFQLFPAFLSYPPITSPPIPFRAETPLKACKVVNEELEV